MLFPRITRLTITVLLLGTVIAAPVSTYPNDPHAAPLPVHGPTFKPQHIVKAMEFNNVELQKALHSTQHTINKDAKNGPYLAPAIMNQKATLKLNQELLEEQKQKPSGSQSPGELSTIMHGSQQIGELARSTIADARNVRKIKRGT